MSDPIVLPDFPDGTEFEELVAAHYQCNGFYVDRNIIEREEKEVLELDVVTTAYTSEIPEITLVEVKSGGWGFSDIFKVAGWLQYNGIERGVLVVKEARNQLSFYEDKASTVNVETQVIDKGGVYDEIVPEHCDEFDVGAWRYAYWVERKLIKYLKDYKSSRQDLDGPKAIDQYYQNINGGIFFLPSTVERLETLYNLYKRRPNLSARCGNELNGNDFSEDVDQIPTNIFAETFYDCERNIIQVSTFTEYLARLTILKNAVDFYLYEEAGDEERGDKILAQIGDMKIMESNFLPNSFKDGLERLSTHNYFERYPIFWQWFIYVFGGFIIDDYKDREYRLLSRKTGIPVDEIENALSVFDILFPTSDDWIIEAPNTNIRILRAFPMPFRGVGANYRRQKYFGEDGEYEDFDVSGRYTVSDIVQWNNLAYEIIDSG